jgi:hypothetical protein
MSRLNTCVFHAKTKINYITMLLLLLLLLLLLYNQLILSINLIYELKLVEFKSI